MSSPTETKMMTEVFTRKKIQKIQLLITMVTPMLDMELLTLTDGEKSTISCQDLTSLFQEPLLKKKPRLRLKMVMMLLKTGLLIHINGEKWTILCQDLISLSQESHFFNSTTQMMSHKITPWEWLRKVTGGKTSRASLNNLRKKIHYSSKLTQISVNTLTNLPTEIKMMIRAFMRKKTPTMTLLTTEVTQTQDMEPCGPMKSSEIWTTSCQDLSSLFQEPSLKRNQNGTNGTEILRSSLKWDEILNYNKKSI